MSTNTREHFKRLEEAYRAVGDRTWDAEDFLASNLERSRQLFTTESLESRKPRPKALEVFALLSGLSFPKDFTDPLVRVQGAISSILGDTLCYWVAPENLGVEHCVFKWPEEAWIENRRGVIESTLGSIRQPCFQFKIGGIQINSDGCVVAKGFDEDGVIFSTREQLSAALPFLPAKQSGWAHVPLGRILEPIGKEKFISLSAMVDGMKDKTIATTDIVSFKFIHEKRWYMEERSLLAEYPLAGRC